MAYSSDSADTSVLLEQVAKGHATAFERLLQLHRPYLKRVIEMRMEPALRVRLDASDVVQETQAVIARGIDYFVTHRPTSFRIWIRRKGLDQLIDQLIEGTPADTAKLNVFLEVKPAEALGNVMRR